MNWLLLVSETWFSFTAIKRGTAEFPELIDIFYYPNNKDEERKTKPSLFPTPPFWLGLFDFVHNLITDSTNWKFPYTAPIPPDTTYACHYSSFGHEGVSTATLRALILRLN